MHKITQAEAVELVKKGELAEPQEKKALQQQRLTELVNYAKANSKFFAKHYSALADEPELKDIPPTAKEMLMKDFDAWVTDPEVTHAKVKEYLTQAPVTSNLLLDRYSVLTTSGTTSEPMPFVRDSYHNNIHGAMMQTRLLRNCSPEVLSPKHSKVACVIATGAHVSSYSSFLRMKNAFPEHKDNMVAFSAWAPIKELVKNLNEFQPRTLTGYPSILSILAVEQKKGNMKISPEVVACSAETLTPANFDLLKEVFGCPILNNYCSTEGGEAAMSCPHGNLHINDDWVLIETIKDNGEPSDPDEFSEAILITDLTNYIQPIIRYRMNDRAKIVHEKCACGSRFPIMQISGRLGDTLHLSGKPVPSLPLIYAMEQDTQEASVYQIAQTGQNRVELRFTLYDAADSDEYIKKASHHIKKVFGAYDCNDTELIISDEPPKVNLRGGKIKNVIKEWSLE